MEDLKMEKFLCAYGGQIECVGKHEIEIEKHKRRDQEILLVQIAEIRGFYPFSFAKYPGIRTLLS